MAVTAVRRASRPGRTRLDRWETYPEMTTSVHQGSDHAAVVVRLDL